MTMYPVLKTPEGLPRWATDAGVALEPSEAKKDEGNVQGKKPPARWHNWLQKMNYEWIKNLLKQLVANWQFCDYTTPPTNCNGVIWHPERGIWFLSLTSGANGAVWTSQDGCEFILDETLTGHLPENRGIAIDSTYAIVVHDDGLSYGIENAAWTDVLNAAIGISSGPDTIATKYGTSDLCMVNYLNEVYIETTDVTGGSWAAASTAPPAVPAGANGKLLYTTGTTFYLMRSSTTATKTYVSTDDGDNWAATAFHPLTTEEGFDMGYNPDTGRLIVVGETAGGSPVPVIEYTDDGGATAWVAATIDNQGLTLDNSSLATVYYCGNNIWVAAGSNEISAGIGYGSRAGFYISDDDGATWVLMYATAENAIFTVGDGIVVQTAFNPHYGVSVCSDGVYITRRNAAYTL
jgi:hypothetical protein